MRVKTDARRSAIVEEAWRAFMTEGYAATSMSAIAARVGGSKSTIYNYFPSKEDLFDEVVRTACESEAKRSLQLPLTGRLDQALLHWGRNYLIFMLDPVVLDFHRMLLAEAARQPEIGRRFFRTGPETGWGRVAERLQQGIAEGAIRDGNPQTMAWHFKGLCEGYVYQRRLWNVVETVSEAELEQHAAEAVECLLRAYAPLSAKQTGEMGPSPTLSTVPNEDNSER